MSGKGQEIRLAHKSQTQLPALVQAAGPVAAFFWDELFKAGIRNSYTRRAYTHAVKRYLA